MPVVPNFVERLAILRLNRGPGPMLDVVSAGGFHGVAAAIDLGVFEALRDGPRSVSDLGGGHGLAAAAFCRAHAGLDATVFDLPAAETYMHETMAREGMTDRVGFVGGDYTTDDLGDGYDAALVFNVVHAHDAAENRALLARVADALAPGGTVAVLDQFEGSAYTPAWKTALQFVGLTYLVTLGARIHDADEVAAWLADAGFEGVRRERVGPGVGLLVAEKAVA